MAIVVLSRSSTKGVVTTAVREETTSDDGAP